MVKPESKKLSVLIVSCFNTSTKNRASFKRIESYIYSLLNSDKIFCVYLFENNTLYFYTKNNRRRINVNCFLELLFFFKRKNITLIIYPSTNVFIELKYLLLSKLFFKKVFLELNEVRKYSITIRTKRNVSFITNVKFLAKYFFSNFQLMSIPFYDGLITISTNITKYYQKYNGNLLQIPILSEIPFKINESVNYNYIDPFIITFSGTINIHKENLDLLFHAISIIEKNINIHFYGHIDLENNNEFLKLLDKFNIKQKVKLLGVVDSSKLKEVFAMSHLLILPRGNTKQNQYGFSTKLSEYLVSGRPVLVTNVSDNAKFIIDNYNGFIIEPDNVEALASKIQDILLNYNKINTFIPINALNTAKSSFDYKLYTNHLLNFLFCNCSEE